MMPGRTPPPARLSDSPAIRPDLLVPRCCLERCGDVPQREIWLHIAAGPLPLGQLDVVVGEWLVGDLAQQVADEVEPASLLVVSPSDVPGRQGGVGGGEHGIPGPGVVIPA